MKQMILLMGGQGVGKGTFARMLNNHNKYKIIETGKMLRDAATTDKTIADIMARGELLPFEILVHLIEKNIDTDHDLLLDGFPRTMDQAKWLVDNYADKFNIHVLYLNVPESVMIARIQKRIREGGGRADDEAAAQHPAGLGAWRAAARACRRVASSSVSAATR